MRVETGTEANCFTPRTVISQLVGHPRSEAALQATGKTALVQSGNSASPSLAPWGLIHHMEIISLLFPKPVNQPHNHFLENI